MITEKEKNIIREEAITAENVGQLTNNQLEIAIKNELFHLLVPKCLGGKELSLMEFASFMEELALIEGSFAWAINLGAGANMFAGYMEPEVAKNIFSSKATCVAGSGAVGGTAKKIDGGYLLNGHWKYASGSSHAHFFSLNATLEDENDKIKSFLVPRSQVEIMETWKVMGLKASASNDFKVKDQTVGEEMMFDLLKPSKYVDSPLYRFPFMQLAEINMLVMLTGIAIHFRTLVDEISETKKVIYNEESILLKHHPMFQKLFLKYNNDFEQKRAKTFRLLNQLWHINLLHKKIPLSLEKKFGKVVLQTSIASRNLVNNIYPLMGMSVIYENSEINRVWRDFNVASQHSLLSPLRLHKYK